MTACEVFGALAVFLGFFQVFLLLLVLGDGYRGDGYRGGGYRGGGYRATRKVDPKTIVLPKVGTAVVPSGDKR